MFSKKFLLVALFFAILHPARAQNNADFFSRWEARALLVETSEPRWATPLITTTPLLDQTLRTDFQHSTQAKNARLWNLGASKGMKLVVAPRLEIDFNTAPYLIHSPNHRDDGFGDVTFLSKYRIFARTEKHGNAVLTAFLGGTYPTGVYSNGAKNATVTPTLAGGKGFGSFVAESTLGATLPTAGAATAGRAIAWNALGMYRTGPHLWLELESNTTFYKGGPNDRKTQEFVTPGLIARFRNRSRRGVTVAAGMQFAATRTHTSDHTLVLSGRLHF